LRCVGMVAQSGETALLRRPSHRGR
jgi:hypothetical protein